MIFLSYLVTDKTGWVEAAWADAERTLWCQSYHPTQIDDLRAKAAEYGTPLDDYEALLAEWVASYVPPEPEPLAPEQLQAMVVQATQQRLDSFARTRNYDDVNSAAKYKDITDTEIATLPPTEQPLVEKFRTECRYIALVTAQTWAKLYLILGEVQAGARPAATGFADVEPDLPELAWPQ